MKPLNSRQIMAMIAAGENVHVDFKESIFTRHVHVQRVTQHHELVKDLAAFANTDGGYLLIGVSDEGRVVGFQSSDHIEQRVINLSRDISSPPLSPSLYRVQMGEKEILVIRIKRGAQNLHMVRGKVYIRVHNEVRLASSSEITDIVLKRNHDKLRDLLQEKENLASLISRVSALSAELFKVKNLAAEAEAHDFFEGRLDLEEFAGVNVFRVIRDCEKLLTNLDNLEMGNLSAYIVSANDFTSKLVRINDLLETELDYWYAENKKEDHPD